MALETVILDLRLKIRIAPEAEIPPIIHQLIALARSTPDPSSSVQIQSVESYITRDMLYTFLLQGMDNPNAARARERTVGTFNTMAKNLTSLSIHCCRCFQTRGVCRCQHMGTMINNKWWYNSLRTWSEVGKWCISEKSLLDNPLLTPELDKLHTVTRERVQSLIKYLRVFHNLEP